MQVILHAGAHVTDEDRMVTCLLDSRQELDKISTVVPQPEDYRVLLRDTIAAATGPGADPDARDQLLAAMIPDGGAERVVLSNDSFFGTHKMAVKRMLYPASCARLVAMSQLFEGHDLELYFAIRNPATFLPAILDKTNFNTLDDMFHGYDPLSFRWSELIERIRAQLPDIPITLWCNEDTPLIWAEVLREMSGLDATQPLAGEFALLSEIMTPAGMTRFETYMNSHPGMTEVQKRRVISAFLDKFLNESAMEVEIDLPGWTEELMDQMTELYDEDVFSIPRIPGVRLIAP